MDPELLRPSDSEVSREVAFDDVDAEFDGAGQLAAFAFPAGPSVSGDDWAMHCASRFVRVGDRFLPEWLILRLDGDASAPTITGRVEVRDGVPRFVDLRFHSEPGEGELRSSHLRETQADAILGALAAFAVRVADIDTEQRVLTLEFGGADQVGPSLDVLRRSRANRKLTPEFLRQVAEVYREALRTGRAPTQAVKSRFFVSERMAGGYVQRARKAGLLPPTTPGKKRG
jgi:hypothetical protein